MLVETRGAAGKRDGLAVVAGGLGLVAARLVDVAEALEAVDVVGEATHEVASSNFGLIEAPGVDELDNGVGPLDRDHPRREAHERSRARERTGARVRAAAWTGSRACTSCRCHRGRGAFLEGMGMRNRFLRAGDGEAVNQAG